MPDHWIYAADEGRIANGEFKVIFPAGLPVLLIKKEDQFFALSNKCAHMGCSLSSGSIDGFLLKCPCHDWRFDIRTGRMAESRELGIPSYPTKSENGKLYVNIEG
jgi:nitrite reductase/ring-hydroxylating ferredoxin subunit